MRTAMASVLTGRLVILKHRYILLLVDTTLSDENDLHLLL